MFATLAIAVEVSSRTIISHIRDLFACDFSFSSCGKQGGRGAKFGFPYVVATYSRVMFYAENHANFVVGNKSVMLTAYRLKFFTHVIII